MMKKIKSPHHIRTCFLLCFSMALGSLCSCAEMDEIFVEDPVDHFTRGIALLPAVDGSEMAGTRQTRFNYYDNNSYALEDDVPADDELMESNIGTTLDVFIAGQGDDPFWKQYHLQNGVQQAGVEAQVRNEYADLLAKSWDEVVDDNNNPLVPNHKYDVYVAVNNTATHATIANKEALMKLKFNNENVYKLYGASTTGIWDYNRRMLMDGHVEWTCKNEALQTIEVPLKRAEAKIVATIDFSPAFYARMIDENEVETPIGTAAWKFVNWCFDTKVFAEGEDISDPTLHTEEERSTPTEHGVTSGPYTYYIYDGPEKGENGTLTGNNTRIYFMADEEDSYGQRYLTLYPVGEGEGNSTEHTIGNVPISRIITYDYTSAWNDAPEDKAPYLLVSFPFYKKDTPTTFNYYRIPFCDEKVNTCLLRNHIYKVDAIISGAGSTSLKTNEKDVDLHYEVLPWLSLPEDNVDVKANKFHYFYVTPTTYNLRGNDTQAVDLNYYAAKGDVVKFKNLQVYYYNSSGTKVYIYGSTDDERNAEFTTKSLTGNNNAGKNYTVTINDDGTITVSSEALDNRAVKYISFQAYMTYVDEEGRTQTMTEDIVIKHFPLDNIQNVEGSWSSKYTSYTMVEQDFTETTYNPAIGETWKNDNHYSKTKETCNSNDSYIAGEEEVEGTSGNYTTRKVTESNQQEFQSNVTSNQRRRNANSEANNRGGYWGQDPIVVSASDNYDYYVVEQVTTETDQNTFHQYVNSETRRQNANSSSNARNGYYGTDPEEVNSDDTYDYTTTTGYLWYTTTHYWKYTHYWHISDVNVYYKYSSYWKYTYWRTSYYRYLYSHTIRKMVPTVTSNWVMWDPDHTIRYNNSKTVYDGLMYAKTIYPYNGLNYCVPIQEEYNYQGYIANYNTQTSYGTNNHMYIIQVSSTSDQYVLGRPIVNETSHQSQDDVVSPAFMTASQLGAMAIQGEMTAERAANHCAQYMEVSIDGTKYVGWRLPTKKEISIIIDYQTDSKTSESMAEVLAYHYYYALDGTSVENTKTQHTTSTATFVRCVRDLSPEEIDAINSKQ